MFISVVQASSREKLGCIPRSSLCPGRYVPSISIALSDDEAFVAVQNSIKVFDRTERVPVELAFEREEDEVASGLALKREILLTEKVCDVLWSHDKLVALTGLAVIVLDRNGNELNRWAAEGHLPTAEPALYYPIQAALVPARGDRPQELAVLDENGNFHFYK